MALKISTCALVLLVIFYLTCNNVEAIDKRTKKLSQNLGGPSMKFMYCYSCGYRKVFEDYIGIIQQKYPEIRIDGFNYDPPGMYLYLAKFLSAAKMALILCILTRVNIFQFIGLEEPTWWTWCLENKMYSCIMLFFLSNTIEGQLISSGAFEITLNDIPVWSKLETGRIPQPPELFQIIDNHMNVFADKVEFKPEFVK
uniref:Putative selenoprotein t n=1 Tax=Xenopsylla cheopis TaxID=163159 RepID=A0A6M2DWK9_XENCH